MSEVTAEMIERGRGLDPKAVTARRQRGVKVQRARERLTTSDTGHRGSDLALLRAYAAARESSAVSGFSSDRDGVAAGLLLDQVQCHRDLGRADFLKPHSLLWRRQNLGRVEDARVTVKQWSTQFI